MAQHTWTFDAPSGVYKSHTMSRELRHAAIVETKAMQFINTEPGYGRKKGDSITITRVSNITVPSNPRLTEGQKISEDELTLTTKAITVAEFGRAVPFTSLSDDLSEFNIENAIQRALRDQMKVAMDNTAFEAFTSSDAKVKAIPTGLAALTFDTDGTASSTGVANLNFYHVETTRDYMKDTLQVPPAEGDDYICLASTKALRGLKRDPDWEEWKKYTDPAAKFNGEVGRLENVRFIESNNTSALSSSLGSGGVQGEAVFFGDDAVVMAVAHDPELRAKVPQDYGRDRGVAWYGILEFGVVWDTASAGEAKIVHFTSA